MSAGCAPSRAPGEVRPLPLRLLVLFFGCGCLLPVSVSVVTRVLPPSCASGIHVLRSLKLHCQGSWPALSYTEGEKHHTVRKCVIKWTLL